MSDCTRTFVAISLPDRLDRKLSDCQAMLAPGSPGFRWASGRPFHATLAFLGDVNNRDLSRVCESIQASVADFKPIELALDGLGAFPNPKRPRVIWAGLTTPAPAPATSRLIELHRAVVQAVTRAGYRPDDDDKEFHPHVTLGRLKTARGRPTDLTSLLERHNTDIAGTFTATEVLTLASTLGPAGPSYTTLARAALKCENGAPPA
jgi:RNA 2',3'-cyclic 3'-phosphodiesterase